MSTDIIQAQAKTPAEMALKLLKLKEIKAEVEKQLDDINARLLTEMSQLGVLTLKTEQMTITRAKRITPKVANMADAKAYFRTLGLEFATKTIPDDVTMHTIRQMVKDGQQPDGVEAQETEYVTVRVAK